MGSSDSFHIDMDFTYTTEAGCEIYNKVEDEIKKVGLDWGWNKWSEQTKWSPVKDIKIISKLFPEIIFRYQSSGNNGYFRWFYLNGECVNEFWVLPKFPSKSTFKKGKAASTKYFAEEEKKDKIAAEKKAEADRLAKIAKLETELKQLKVG